MNKSDPHIIILGNYADFSTSMPKYGTLLESAINTSGLCSTHVIPPKIFGKLWPSPHGIGKWLGYVDKYLLFPGILKRKLKEILKTHPHCILHIVDHSNSIYYATSKRLCPTTITCHDTLAIQRGLGQFNGLPVKPTFRIQQRQILKMLCQIPHKICVSHATAKSLSSLCSCNKDCLEVIYSSMNRHFTRHAPAEARLQLATLHPQLRLEGRLLLHIGRNQWYKNRNGVIHLFQQTSTQSGEQLHLIIAGAPPTEATRLLVDSLGIRAKVTFLPDVPDDEIDLLYAAADLFLFPSIQEGFGWPIIEAQACGCIVVTSDRPPMNEIGGPAVFTIPPPEVDSDLVQWAASNAATCLAALSEEATDRKRRIRMGLEHADRFSLGEMGAHLRSYYCSIISND